MRHAALQCSLQFDLDDLARLKGIGFGGYQGCLVVQRQRAVGGEDFESVPLGWIVAGREHQAVGELLIRCGIGDQRCGYILGQQLDGDIVAGKDLGRGMGGNVAQKAPVVADEHAVGLASLASHLVGQRLAEPSHVVQREAFADARPPAAGAEADQVVFLGALGPQLSFLQNEGLLVRVRPAC